MRQMAAQRFKGRDVEADGKTCTSHEGLIDCIDRYDGLAVRSSTRGTLEVLAAGSKLKVVGRAGIGRAGYAVSQGVLTWPALTFVC